MTLVCGAYSDAVATQLHSWTGWPMQMLSKYLFQDTDSERMRIVVFKSDATGSVLPHILPLPSILINEYYNSVKYTELTAYSR